MWQLLTLLLAFVPAALAITPDLPVLCNTTVCGACTETPVGLNYAPYAPTARVTRYSNLDTSKGHVFINISEIGSFFSVTDMLDKETYLNAVLTSVFETVVFCFLIFFTFAIWSFFRCCNYCTCCCIGCHSTNPTSTYRWISRFILLILLGGAGALAYFSTDTAKGFNDGISSIGASFNFTSQWIVDVGHNADLVLAESAKVNTSAIELGIALATLPSPAKDNAQEMVDTIQASVETVNSQAGQLSEMLEPLSTPLESVEGMVALGPKYLDPYLAYALYGFSALFGLLVLLVMACTCPPKCCSPTPCVLKLLLDAGVFAFFWIIFIMWIISLLLQLISSFLADICQDPDSIILGLLGGDPMVEYYVTCAGASPFADAVSAINTEFDTATASLEELKSDAYVFSKAGNEINALQLAMTAMRTTLLDNGADGEPVCGLFHETDCAVVNARYQALINGICGGFMEPLSRIFETFIALAAALSILEFMRRLVSGTAHDLPGGGGSDDEDDDEYGLEEGRKYTQTKKIPKSPLGAVMAGNNASNNQPKGKKKKKGSKKGKKGKKGKKKKQNWDDYGDEDYDAYGDMEDEDDGWGEMDGEEAFQHRNSWAGGDGYDGGDWDNGGDDSYGGGGGGTRETHFSPGMQGRDSPGYSNNKSYY